MTDSEALHAAFAFRAAMREMTQEQRLDAIAQVDMYFCLECGKDEIPGDRPCQCRNDE